MEETARTIRTMLASGRLPLPANDARCRECSLKDLCQPEALADQARIVRLVAGLYAVDDAEVSR